MRRSLMKDLADLRKQQQMQQQQKASNQQPKARTMAVDPLKSSRLGSNNQKAVPQPAQIQRPATSSTSTAGFRYDLKRKHKNVLLFSLMLKLMRHFI